MTEPGQTNSKSRFPVPPQVVALSLARFADAFGNALLFVVLPLYFDQFQLQRLPVPPELTIGILIGLGPLVSFIVQPFVGMVADRTLRYKLITQIGLLITAVAVAGFMISNNVWHLAFFRSLQGAGVGLTIPTAMALTSMFSKRGNRGRSMSFFIAARMLGLGSGPLVGGFVLVSAGFQVSLALASALVFLGFIAVQVLVREPEKPPRHAMNGATINFGTIFRQKGFLTIAAINVILAMSLNILAPLENEVNHRLGQTAAEFGVALSLSLFSNLLFQAFSGTLADKIGRKPVVLIGLAVLAPATAMIPFASTTLMLWGIMILEGAATAFIGSPLYALAGDMASEGGVGRQLSILTASFGLGLAIGPLLAGIFGGFLGFHAPFMIASALTAIALLVAFRQIREPKPES